MSRDVAAESHEFRDAVTQLIATPAFLAHVGGNGLTPWVYLDHAPGRRGARRHVSGSRARAGRLSGNVASDPRLTVAVEPTVTNDASLAAVVGTSTFTCECGQRVAISELSLLKVVVAALLSDTRRDAQYVGTVQ